MSEEKDEIKELAVNKIESILRRRVTEGVYTDDQFKSAAIEIYDCALKESIDQLSG